MMTLADLQFEHDAWLAHNFPDQAPHEPLLGIVEEAGELAHAHLKYQQGIRGYDKQRYGDEATDAIGDLIIYLASYCNSNGLNLQRCMEETWFKVQKRDWQLDPIGGTE